MSEAPPKPVRLPRSLAETPAYNPEWRHLQVHEYLRFRLQAGDPQGSLILPSSEKDLLVRAYFNFQCGKPGPQTAALRYAYDCNEDNDRLLVGSRIKAWTVAGFTTEEIAQRLHTSPDRVRVYQGLFFEVREYQTDRFAMGAILSPLLLPDSLVPPAGAPVAARRPENGA